MWWRVVLLFCAFVCVKADSEYLYKKFCNDVSPHMCDVYNVILDPCTGGHQFCSVKRTKKYVLSIDFKPKFSADKLNLTISADDFNNGSFDKMVKSSTDACVYMTCPVEAQTRRVFDVDFSLGKAFAVGKFPVKFKIYNKDDASQSCCFTFNVKIMK